MAALVYQEYAIIDNIPEMRKVPAVINVMIFFCALKQDKTGLPRMEQIVAINTKTIEMTITNLE